MIIGIPVEIHMTLNKYIEDVLNQIKKQIKVITVISRDSYIDLFKKSLDYFEVKEWDYKELYKSEDCILSRFDVKRKLYINTIDNNFLVFQKGELAHIITGGSRSFVQSGIYYITKRLFPKVIIAYLTSSEIYDLIKYFSIFIEKDLYYKNDVRKRMFGERHTDVGYRIGKRRERFRLFEEAFRRASSLGQWIDQITIFSEDFSYYFDLAREGILKIRKGSFEDYYPLLLRICDIYRNRMEFYDNRGRMYQPFYDVKPIIMPLDSKLFYEEDIREQFLDVIKKYTNCQYSIVYSGNPHIHVNIIDKIDNSMFSIKTYYSDSLIIIPQVKTSEASLIRFTKHLFKNFREANAIDFEV